MAEYIDRESLGIGKANRDVFADPKYADGWNAAIEIIQNAPAADVVEVVRCKDCFYYSQDGHTAYCLHPEYEHWYADWYADGADDTCFNPSTKENHFCSYGERKDGAK